MIGLTFDVEERFHSHLTPANAERRWMAADRIARILDLLVEHGRQATFFVVGELALRYPALIRRMSDAGFEVASHSHTHLHLERHDHEVSKADITRSKDVLEQVIGRPVIGFRAPSWSARLSDEWLWQHLLELGFRYDSSLFPFRTHLYGSFSNPTSPHRLPGGLLEVPPAASTLGPLRLPYGGGFYFRLYPARLTHLLVERDLRRGRTPVVYFHPWEFDPSPEGVEVGPLNRFIANIGGGGAWHRLADLLRRYPTVAVRDLAATLAS